MARPKGLVKTGGRRAGTLNRATAEVKVLAQEYTAAAILTLAEIMANPEAPPAARVSAASALLDRGHGKPPQAITGLDGSPLIPERAADPDRIAGALLLMVEAPATRAIAGLRVPPRLVHSATVDAETEDETG
jgi:hypothetical protein